MLLEHRFSYFLYLCCVLWWWEEKHKQHSSTFSTCGNKAKEQWHPQCIGNLLRACGLHLICIKNTEIAPAFILTRETWLVGAAGPNTAYFTLIPVGWDQLERRGTGHALARGTRPRGGRGPSRPRPAQPSAGSSELLPGLGLRDPPLGAGSSMGWSVLGLFHRGLDEVFLGGARSCCSALSGALRRAGGASAPHRNPFVCF